MYLELSLCVPGIIIFVCTWNYFGVYVEFFLCVLQISFCAYVELILCVPGIIFVCTSSYFVCTSNYFCVYVELFLCVPQIIFVGTSNYFCVYFKLIFVRTSN